MGAKFLPVRIGDYIQAKKYYNDSCGNKLEFGAISMNSRIAYYKTDGYVWNIDSCVYIKSQFFVSAIMTYLKIPIQSTGYYLLHVREFNKVTGYMINLQISVA